MFFINKNKLIVKILIIHAKIAVNNAKNVKMKKGEADIHRGRHLSRQTFLRQTFVEADICLGRHLLRRIFVKADIC